MGSKITRTILATFLLFYLLSLGLSANFDKAVNDFAITTYANANNGTVNVLLSPIFLQDALAVLFTSSNGQTATDLAKGLNFGTANRDQVVKSFHKFMRSARRLDRSSITLDIANKFYVKQNLQISNEFKGYACKLYSYVEPIDFATSTVAATMINTWVKDHTNNTLQDFVTPDMLGPDTSLVVVSAIYLNGFWKHKFNVRPNEEFFHIAEGNNGFTFFIYVQNEFLYGNIDSLDATAVVLPYNNSDVSMLILLPNERFGLSTLESKLTTFDLSTILKQMTVQTVEVSLPRGYVDFKIDLKNVLNQMDMGIIYTDQADFTALQSGKSLKVSSVLQEAYVVFDVYGAEAAGTGETTADVILPITFNADHPFMFLVTKGLDILFIGRVVLPKHVYH